MRKTSEYPELHRSEFIICNECAVHRKYKQSAKYTKSRLYSFDTLNTPFFTVKPGFTGVYINFVLFQLKNIDCGYSLVGSLRRF